MLQIVVHHFAAQTGAGTDGLRAAVGVALAQRRDPVAVDKDFRQRMGVNQLQVCRFSMGDFAHVPAS